jgi:glycosyltransferase involved in cell wall biosynthesis
MRISGDVDLLPESLPAYWQALLCCVVTGVPRVAFYESTLASRRFERGPVAIARRRFLRAMDVVVVPGEAAAEAVMDIGVAPSRVVVSFNAIDMRSFRAAADRARQRTQTFGSSSTGATGHRFIYVGQLIDRKRVDRIIAAFAAVAEPDDQLTIVGRGFQKAELQDLAEQAGVATQLRWIDQVENQHLGELLVHQNSLVLASDSEVWGLVVNEALSVGLHAIVTDNCGVVASVRHMRGVYVASTESDMQSTLEAAMVASRKHWAGLIDEPEISRHTPESFAEDFAVAIKAAIQSRPRRFRSLAKAFERPVHQTHRAVSEDRRGEGFVGEKVDVDRYAEEPR